MHVPNSPSPSQRQMHNQESFSSGHSYHVKSKRVVFLRHKWIVILSIVQQSQFWTNIKTSSNLGFYCHYPECTARASTSIQLWVTSTM
jgi:hypothetical protein